MLPMGVIALSISAAVVPGAKFCAMTTKGPARPRIVNPLLNDPPDPACDSELIVPKDFLADAGRSSVLIRASATCAARRFWRGFPAGPAFGFEIREAREPDMGLLRALPPDCELPWRSYAHPPFRLPVLARGCTDLFAIPARLAREPPGPLGAFAGTLERRLPKILAAKASFFLRSRPVKEKGHRVSSFFWCRGSNRRKRTIVDETLEVGGDLGLSVSCHGGRRNEKVRKRSWRRKEIYGEMRKQC